MRTDKLKPGKPSNKGSQYNTGYLSRVFTANGFEDNSKKVMPRLNGSADYLKSIGQLEFLMEKAEQMAYTAGKPATANGVLGHFDFSYDDIKKMYQSHRPDLMSIPMNMQMINPRDSGKTRSVTLDDVAKALMKNLEYRRNMIQQRLSEYSPQSSQRS